MATDAPAQAAEGIDEGKAAADVPPPSGPKEGGIVKDGLIAGYDPRAGPDALPDWIPCHGGGGWITLPDGRTVSARGGFLGLGLTYNQFLNMSYDDYIIHFNEAQANSPAPMIIPVSRAADYELGGRFYDAIHARDARAPKPSGGRR